MATKYLFQPPVTRQTGDVFEVLDAPGAQWRPATSRERVMWESDPSPTPNVIAQDVDGEPFRQATEAEIAALKAADTHGVL